MYKMKKGQTETIFIWIFIAVVAGLIFIFGFKMIKNITNTGEDVVVVKFFQNFEKKVNDFYYLDEGSQGRESFNLPSWVEKVCFRKGNDLSGGFGVTLDAKTRNLVMSDGFVDRNAFLVPIKDSGLHMKNVKFLENSQNNCIDVVNGNIEITFENVGGKVNVR